MFIKIPKEKNTFNMQNIIPNIQSRSKSLQCSLKKCITTLHKFFKIFTWLTTIMIYLMNNNSPLLLHKLGLTMGA